MKLNTIDVTFEQFANLAAQDNHVELAWFMRGVFDGARGHGTGERPADTDYSREYMTGYDAGTRWANGEVIP